MSDKNIFETDIRIRYAETDQMGVTYYGSYLVWYEVARTEYFRSCGLDYTQMEANGQFLAVVNSHCNYLAPTRYDDLITVKTWVSSLGKTSMEFAYEVVLKDTETKVADGSTAHVFVDKSMKPIRIPEEIHQAFSK